MTAYVYALIDPRDNRIRYIGTTNDMEVRLKYHLGHLKTNRTHKSNWLLGLLSDGFTPLVKILETLDSEEEAFRRETFWISYGHRQGWALTNHTDGGEGAPGYKWTDEQRQKFSQKKKGSRFTDSHRKSLSDAQKLRLETKPHVRTGKTHTEESKAKMANTKRGKKSNYAPERRSVDREREWRDPEIRARRSEAIRLKWQDADYRAKMKASREKGKTKC
jgi:group I intron endonuclease